jgi:hypothetical protein
MVRTGSSHSYRFEPKPSDVSLQLAPVVALKNSSSERCRRIEPSKMERVLLQVEELLAQDSDNAEFQELNTSLAEVVDLTRDLLQEALQGSTALSDLPPSLPPGAFFSLLTCICAARQLVCLPAPDLLTCSSACLYLACAPAWLLACRFNLLASLPASCLRTCLPGLPAC